MDGREKNEPNSSDEDNGLIKRIEALIKYRFRVFAVVIRRIPQSVVVIDCMHDRSLSALVVDDDMKPLALDVPRQPITMKDNLNYIIDTMDS